MARSLGKDVIAAALAGAVLIVVPTQAQTQDNLSEKLNRLMQGAKRGEQTNPLDDLTKSYDQTLSQGAAAQPEQRRMALRARASVYESAKEYDRAEADLTTALRMQPADAGDYAERGYFYLRRGRYTDALQDFSAGAKVEPNAARFRYGAARVQATMQNYAAAVELYDQAIRLSPNDGPFHLSRAEARLNLKKPAEAKSDYDQAIKLGLKRPADRYFAHVGRGYVNLLLESFPAAVADFDRALEIAPMAVNAWVWRGVANERRGHTDAAIADFEHAYMIEPENGMVMANLRRLRANESQAVQVPAFQIDEKKRLAQDALPGPVPRRRPQM
jgi:tetratricopeptide (TPR) repeat protein